ncbi:MAG: tetratricopeptide repeat protein, partial [Myxococcales bacterium]|nr:tetratricopeptide repeat protein [Myxococcales bacterium]
MIRPPLLLAARLSALLAALLATLLTALLTALLAPTLALAADRDPARVEADRLTTRAAARGAEAGGAVDLIRLAELADWIPHGELPARLRAAATDRRRAPLVRAVAWWLLREDALARLDAPTAAEAAAALGLLDGFALRIGGAPHPTAALEAGPWQPWPRGAGAGELWLESILRPDREVTATAVTRLVSPTGGPAVLRLGYDDAATVWLNGDEVFAADATHPAWLDQVAIPVVLRPGDNRLVVELRQRDGAWRLIARVTDPKGDPLPVQSHPDPWGEVPAPAEGERPDAEAIAHLWTALYAAAETDPPVAADLRDMADYARVTGLPDADQALPRVAIEGAWATEPSPRTLRAWLRILPEGEQARVQSGHAPARPIEEADHWSDLDRQTAAAWTHYHARRHGEARRAVEAILAHAPDHLPAIRLAAVIHEDLGLSHTGAALLARARARWPDRPGLIRAHLAALQTGGRVIEAITLLEAWVEAGGGPDAHYQLAALLAARGETARAVALLDAVTAARPELWTYGVEAAEILLAAGETDEARRRLTALWEARPGDASIAERLARLHVEQGDPDAALAVVDRALAVDPGAGLDAMRARL